MNKLKNNLSYAKYLIVSFIIMYNSSALANVTNQEVLAKSSKSIQQVANVLNWFTGISFALAFMLSIAALYVNSYRTGRAIQAGDSSNTNRELQNLIKLFTNIAIGTSIITIVGILARVTIYVVYKL